MFTVAFGISSLFFAIVAFFTPIFGVYITGLSGLMACGSTGKGSPLGLSSAIINIFNLFLFSPIFGVLASFQARYGTQGQTTAVAIWSLMLFIQIVALVVHIAKYYLENKDIKKTVQEKDTKRTDNFESKLEQSSYKSQQDFGSSEDKVLIQKHVSPVTKTIIYKLFRGKTLDSKFWQSEFNNESKSIEDIPLDGSMPHRSLIFRNRKAVQVFSIVVGVIAFLFVLVILRPDLFPFLEYHSVYSVFSKSFPENYLDRYKTDPPPQSIQVTSTRKNNEISIPSSDVTYNVQHSNTYSSPAAISDNPNIKTKNKWYIIELQTGENILTQFATEADGIITVISSEGRERKVKRSDVKNVKKIFL